MSQLGIGQPVDDSAYSSTLTIEETESSGNGKTPRKIILLGGGLPFIGAEWGITNQLITTWYPGNPDEATQQNLGPQELPSSWQGEWKRTLLGRTPIPFTDETGVTNQVVSPSLLRDAIESMAREGIRLRVTWTLDTSVVGVTAKIVREGRVKQFKYAGQRQTDITWQIEFHWQSRGSSIDRVTSTRADNLGAGLAGLNSAFSNLTSAVNSLSFISSNLKNPLSATHFTLGQLEQLANYPNAFATKISRQIQAVESQIKQVADIAKTIAGAPAQVQKTFQNLAEDTKSNANQVVDSLSQVPPEKMSTSQKMADVIKAHNYFGGVSDNTRATARAAHELSRSIRQPLFTGANQRTISHITASGGTQDNLIAVWITKPGDSPAKLSQKFYNNADHGIDILKANRLSWYTTSFQPGTKLLIPRLNTSVFQP